MTIVGESVQNAEKGDEMPAELVVHVDRAAVRVRHGRERVRVPVWIADSWRNSRVQGVLPAVGVGHDGGS